MEEPSKRPKEDKVPRATKEETEEETEEQPKGKYSFDKLKPLIIPVLLALAVSFFLINIMAVPKGTYNNAVAGLSSRMAAVETSMDDLKGLPGSVAAQIQGVEEDMAKFQPNIDQLVALAIKVDNFEAQLAGLEIPSEGSLTTIVDNKIAVYEMTLSDIKADLEALWVEVERVEEEEEEEDIVTTDDTTLWTKEFYSTSDITIDYTVSPTKFEEAGDYIIMVYLYNYAQIAKSDVVVDIILSPKTGDRVKVDEAAIYLDSTRSPFYAWFRDIVKRSDETCRRMVFTSEQMRIDAATPVGEGIDPGRLTLRLEFTLAYK